MIQNSNKLDTASKLKQEKCFLHQYGLKITLYHKCYNSHIMPYDIIKLLSTDIYP